MACVCVRVKENKDDSLFSAFVFFSWSCSSLCLFLISSFSFFSLLSSLSLSFHFFSFSFFLHSPTPSLSLFPFRLITPTHTHSSPRSLITQGTFQDSTIPERKKAPFLAVIAIGRTWTQLLVTGKHTSAHFLLCLSSCPHRLATKKKNEKNLSQTFQLH